MLRITECKSAAGAKQYYTANRQADYYIEGQEPSGKWGGRLAQEFGLSGNVARKDFYRLVDGLDPRTGAKLTPDKRKNIERRVGYDWTFSAPKSVSLLLERSGDSRIIDAFEASIDETMAAAEIEMKTRVRTKGQNEDRVTGNMAWGRWTHRTTRPLDDGTPDMHLHGHVFVLNMTKDDVERRIKAGQFGDLKRDGRWWDAVFESRLAQKLNALGYATERDGDSFRIAGLDRAMTDKYSRRTKEVERKIRDLEKDGVRLSDKEKARIGEKTRQPKGAAERLTKGQLQEKWWARLTPEEEARLDRAVRREIAPPHDASSPEEAMNHAVAHLFEASSTVSEKRLKEAALRHGVGSVSVEDINGLVKRDGIYSRSVNGEEIVTTREVLQEEMDMLRIAREGRGTFIPLGNARADLGKRLEGEQRAAALHVLNSRDRVTGIRGGAGTGKTTMMHETITAIAHSARTPDAPKRNVTVLAPFADTVETLRKEGFAQAQTVEYLLRSKEMQRQVRGQLLWVDEAGLLGSRDMHRLFALAEANNNRILLSGDYRQHGSVGRGNATLRLLETDGGVRFAELKKVRRQKDARYREAVEMISRGTAEDAAKGFERLDEMGCLVRGNGKRRHEKLVADYVKALEEGKTVLVIAPTHREGNQLTARLREALKQKGRIETEERTVPALDPIRLTEAERKDGRHYAPGHVVEFHQNAKGFRRGERVTVVDYADAGRAVIVERQNGRHAELPLQQAERFQVYRRRELRLAVGDTVRNTKGSIVSTAAGEKPARRKINNGAISMVTGFTETGGIALSNGMVLPRDYGHLRYGLVDTSFASQGKTVDRVLVAMGNQSLGAMNREQFYVSASRGREECRIYLDRPDETKWAVQKSGARMSAVELMRERKLEGVLRERNRIGRFLKARAAAIAQAWRGLFQKPAAQESGGMNYA